MRTQDAKNQATKHAKISSPKNSSEPLSRDERLMISHRTRQKRHASPCIARLNAESTKSMSWQLMVFSRGAFLCGMTAGTW
ncbi:hypothetical protein ACPWT1_07970 [Ramlibacter sp. MMS24-I3-19]|uniref:hypothetical protein n=1 Tax=Ramlibacter sp. MMS24-I3-19 TaxID=3416606 RepID=UPI003D041613